MKRTRSDHKKGGIQWDEANLEENDKIKSEINPRKINEPKTPYHGPVEEEPGCGEPGMSPLRLEEEVTTALDSGQSYRQGHPKPHDDDAHAGPDLRYEEPIAEEGDYSQANSWQSGDSIRSTRSSDGGDVSTADGESNSAPKADKRQRFADHRKDHYDMRNALQKGKELVTELYHTNTEDEQQNGSDSQRQHYQADLDDEH